MAWLRESDRNIPANVVGIFPQVLVLEVVKVMLDLQADHRWRGIG
jgi:hypothetical protein